MALLAGEESLWSCVSCAILGLGFVQSGALVCGVSMAWHGMATCEWRGGAHRLF